MSQLSIKLPAYGAPSWKYPVASATDLPALSNTPGDMCLTIDTKTLYEWDGSSWVAVATPGAAIALDGLNGDGMATGPGVAALTLATVNSNIGTFTKITVNAKGLVTSATTLSASDIPDISASYLSTSGGNVSGPVGINGSGILGGLAVKATGSSIANGFNIISSGGISTANFLIRDNGNIFIYDGSNVVFNSSGSLCGTGPSAPNYQWDVNRGNSATTITAQNQVCTVGIRNTDSTNGNFSELAFVNNQPKIDSAIVGVHDVQGASYTGSLHFLTSSAGTLSESVIIDSSGQLALQRAGAGLSIKTGSNCKLGIATLSAGTVTVANTVITASSLVFLTHQTVSGTPGVLSLGTVTAGTSFVINSSSGTDASIVAYLIVEPS